jgi:hypothetical protein
MSMSENKKLLYIGLEPDMFFEIADTLKQVIEELGYLVIHRVTTPEEQRKYLYLKSIVALLETQLTH